MASNTILNEISEIIVKYRENEMEISPTDIYNEWSNTTAYHEKFNLDTVIWLLDFIKDLQEVSLEMLKEAVKLDKHFAK